jgi:phytoene dehydrogenase-like protein
MVKLSTALLLLCTQLQVGSITGFTPVTNLDARNNNGIRTATTTTSASTTSLALNWFGFGKKGNSEDFGDGGQGNDGGSSIAITNTQQKDYVSTDWLSNNLPSFNKDSPAETGGSADIVIVGGGISGLAAAITAAEALGQDSSKNIVLLEANSKCGGRVTSETTPDGFVLDEGFAVFIEEYPAVKKLLDYKALELKRFLPGAFVKIQGRDALARVADPLRNPEDIFDSVLSPIGSLIDKVKVLPLVLNVRLSSVDSIFAEPETDTKTALVNRWGFSDEFINTFLKPFLEGIYLAPLPEQSSRMFSFVFKMFSDGSATLPKGGMVAITNQLVDKAESLGVTILTDTPVIKITPGNDEFVLECTADSGGKSFQTSSVVVATDGQIAKKIIGNVKGFESLKNEPDQRQRSVGCVYYGFEGPAPVEEPILVLNGMKDANDDPVNNICFPSMVNEGYAPEGYNLCSVTILSDVMDRYMDKPEELDQAVRRQLGTWFADQQTEIMEEWDLKKIFYVSATKNSIVLASKFCFVRSFIRCMSII